MSFFSRNAPDTPARSSKEVVPGDGQLYCTFVTNMGSMTAELYEDAVPRTVANFVGLATGDTDWTDPTTGGPGEGALYTDVLFHRVIDGFMLQCGDPTGTGRGGPGYRFKDEFDPSLRHTGKGILSMANAGPNTNGSQFFVCQVPTPWLDGKHSVFGKVIENTDLIDTIARVPKGAGDRPRQDVVLHRVDVFRR
ncbi:MAG: peptidylprolyl isomerase [Alphaproteobacteria bacterium]|nr:peptidylprolyl isomerase [Alphaproteobacteria bacterium]MCB9795687.1 peptidylprolyl isomerase [Alphaproteobacteria bacterium]